jgi:membrane protease YdiL (CAAX protease family)
LLPSYVAADPFTLFPFALVLGTLYCRAHRIVPAIVLHAALNTTSLVLLWLQTLG